MEIKRKKKNIYYLKYVTLLMLLLCSTCAKIDNKQRFKVYAFIPWPSFKLTSEFTEKYQIFPIYIVYDNRFMSDRVIDEHKIKQLALDTLKHPEIPVSFDMELSSRFVPTTLIPQIKEIITLFRKYNKESKIGMYATLPQNVFGEPHETRFSYQKLNEDYKELISWVDFLSPSLYNYEQFDTTKWIENAKYSIRVARHYAQNKPIIPYISPIIRLGQSSKAKNGNLVVALSESEMNLRFKTLIDLQVSGCIVWASSQDRDQQGAFPRFNPLQGWGKSILSHARIQ